ncbi:hypothetical protein BN14_04560 [Rhizoctonia solani AG-1 IB]|uniref:Uncharacterized protein n=1 Tax=Thanatephorus cucumeris (strain AG1-IB / isolate 7/3/14) TaxID=1108050 RepID=M5BTI2_THACB|nr:hypothetical protein BN14_04560 [Rhizoctonia solani AG-1 IB]
MTHKRKLSDTPTLIDSNDQNTESEVQIKRESPPYQLSGSQSQELDPSSSSMASFVSNSTVSTGLTSDDGGATEGAQDANAELAGYDPKYGNKADYLRRQKVRSKAIESIEERTRRAGQRQDDKTIQKSPVRPTDAGSRHASGPSVSPVRGRDLPSRTYSVSSVPGLNGQDNNATLRRTPSVDLPPSQDFPTSPRGRVASSSLRSPSPTSGKYPHPHRDSSPAREYRPQYNPYDDPRSVRPRPIVSSPPRGSPPRESPAHRTAIELQSLDSYCNMYPRTETRSFDLRRSSSDMPGDNETNWPRMRRGAPPIQPPRSSPPPRDLIRERTSFGSGVLPANPNAGYRPEGLPELPSARYSPYDATSRRVEWAARDWERPTDSKPKLQDRFTMDSQWRDSIESRRYTDYASRPLRDEFTHPTDSYGTRYRREPSPGAPRYADGFRSGFSRPVEVEGIRPMKRSRPDDSYPPRGGVNMEEFEGLDDHSSAFFRRKPAPSRRDDEYDPRLRPPY